MLIDSHSHFDLCAEEGAPIESLMDGLRDARVTQAVQVAIDRESSAWSRDFAVTWRDAGILFTMGIHPSSPAPSAELEALGSLVRAAASSVNELFFGVGECGLDFYRMRQPAEDQRRSFEYQIALAKETGLPLIVHSRDAMDDTLAILEAHRPVAGVMHCFSGTPADARRVMDLGFYLSFAGNVTYPKALDLQESARYAPLDRLLVETDAPFLTPVPHRGKKNIPSHVTHVYRFLAGLKSISFERTAEAVGENFRRLRACHA